MEATSTSLLSLFGREKIHNMSTNTSPSSALAKKSSVASSAYRNERAIAPSIRLTTGGASIASSKEDRTPTSSESESQIPSDINPPYSLPHSILSSKQHGANLPTNASSNPPSHRKRHHSPKICQTCDQPMTGQFVRALGGIYHLDCFKCHDCQSIVASKFFPVDYPDGNKQYPLCETDYFRRLDLLCATCGGALRGSYITALDKKYHIEHFTCSLCVTLFGPQDSYYEHDGQVYCHFHYSTRFAVLCHGCNASILKQFVEIFRNGENQQWHPECYMIHKAIFWNVRLSCLSHESVVPTQKTETPEEVSEREKAMEDRVFRIWTVLSAFEESSAACISDLLLNISNGAYFEGVIVADRFISHIELLFRAIDELEIMLTQSSGRSLPHSREAKLLCKKIVSFFSLISRIKETGVRRLGITQELLSLVTGLAHYLKILIRISLTGALKLERDGNPTAVKGLLNQLSLLDKSLGNPHSSRHVDSSSSSRTTVSDMKFDSCVGCGKCIEEDCVRFGERRWHLPCVKCAKCDKDLRRQYSDAKWSEDQLEIQCLTCSTSDSLKGFIYITKLSQFIFLLRIGLGRLHHLLREIGAVPRTSDDLSLDGYNKTNSTNPPVLHRSVSYSNTPKLYDSTVRDFQILRSGKLQHKLSTSQKVPRQSRIIDGPVANQAETVRSSSPSPKLSSEVHPYDQNRLSTFRIIEDKDLDSAELTFGDEKTLTLDDIPRIVAAEQAREQRPNAYQHKRVNSKLSGPNNPRLVDGRTQCNGTQSSTRPARPHISELSALEYFIVQHIAVLSMQPLLKDYLSLEDLLGLIENRKQTFWGKFGKAFQKNGGDKKKKGVFGVPLEVLVEKAGAESMLGAGPGTLRIPAFIDDAISAMKQMDMSVEGVFRKNGNIRRLKKLSETLDKGSQINLNEESPVQLAALLKKFLRDLPDPLLTSKLFQLFVTTQRIDDEETRQRLLHLTCLLMPKSHRESMEVVFWFLKWVASFSHVDEESGSKMDAHNLATVIAPNVLCRKNNDGPADEPFLAIEAVHTIMLNIEEFSMVPSDLVSIMQDSSLFAGSAELTTKDILKRYEDVIHQTNGSGSEVSEGPTGFSGRNKSRSVAPQRVNTDAAQAFAVNQESSARRVISPESPGFTVR
ncbi:Rho-type GTPase-activating protein 1 [Neolecta irregularis DAH-3]|uniref:Rho-type GTPase-activating protein 1 n=1 Tax=Neolecta irregularis (strain DAH-3) TaxID=1198029 RepID=A0A1U7LV68_NEOID|nr:Rho-type GTPase-activating protein 1 [Neolecta irregularis DAH-3]|eukprot:OLL26519.1 Rho-type GTPase-activating protein 1 [Neolecta irregularis DAH-3]